MSFLLDTNAVSEWVKPFPNPGLISWLEEVDEDRVFLSVATLTELRYGVERLGLATNGGNSKTGWKKSFPFDLKSESSRSTQPCLMPAARLSQNERLKDDPSKPWTHLLLRPPKYMRSRWSLGTPSISNNSILLSRILGLTELFNVSRSRSFCFGTTIYYRGHVVR